MTGISLRPSPVCGAIAALSLAAVAAFAAWDELAPGFAALADPDALSATIQSVGPVAVVLLLALAVIVSPIPSGPVAMAAGALYGTVEGGALTAAGALLGAMGAFGLSRALGYRPLCAAKFPLATWITRPRSQAHLAFAVLGLRLIPFVSFDAVSYLAGVTSIRTLPFAAATTLGILPASFAFAALGAGAMSMNNSLLFIIACGLTLILPAALCAARGLKGFSQKTAAS